MASAESNSVPSESSATAVLTCHLYKDTPSTRIENELRELYGAGINSDAPLDAEELLAIDTMHYEGQNGTLRMMKLFPAKPAGSSPVQVLDLGSGFGGCARFVALRAPEPAGARVTALEIQAGISDTAAVVTKRCGLADKVTHATADASAPEGLGAVLGPAHGTFEVVFSKLVVLHIPYEARKQLWANLAAAAPGALLYLEDFFDNTVGDGRGDYTSEELTALETRVGCPRPPTREAWCKQLEDAGCTNICFEDCTPAWAAFVAGRSANYREAKERHERVQGPQVYARMQEFYDTTSNFLGSARLGGCFITAQLPSK